MVQEETQQSIWNFDGAELYAIFGIKQNFMEHMANWNLEKAYWSLREIRREIDAKLKRKDKKLLEEFEESKSKVKSKKTEKEEVDDYISELDKSRKEFNDSNGDDESKCKFYLKLEDVYMKLCHVMKRHGLYFREGEDMRLAVLKR